MKKIITSAIFMTYLVSCGSSQKNKKDDNSTNMEAWNAAQLTEAKEMYVEAIQIALPDIKKEQSENYSNCIVSLLEKQTTYEKWLDDETDSLISSAQKEECLKSALAQPKTETKKSAEHQSQSETKPKGSKIDVNTYLKSLGEQLDFVHSISEIPSEEIYPIRDELSTDDEKLKIAIQGVLNWSIPEGANVGSQYKRIGSLTLVLAYVNKKEASEAISHFISKANMQNDLKTIDRIINELAYYARFNEFGMDYLIGLHSLNISENVNVIIAKQVVSQIGVDKLKVKFLLPTIHKLIYSSDVEKMKTGLEFLDRVALKYGENNIQVNQQKEDFLAVKQDYLKILSYIRNLFWAHKEENAFEMLFQYQKDFVLSYPNISYKIDSLHKNMENIANFN